MKKPSKILLSFIAVLVLVCGVSFSSNAVELIKGDCWPATVWLDDCQCAGTAANPDCW